MDIQLKTHAQASSATSATIENDNDTSPSSLITPTSTSAPPDFDMDLLHLSPPLEPLDQNQMMSKASTPGPGHATIRQVHQSPEKSIIFDPLAPGTGTPCKSDEFGTWTDGAQFRIPNTSTPSHVQSQGPLVDLSFSFSSPAAPTSTSTPFALLNESWKVPHSSRRESDTFGIWAKAAAAEREASATAAASSHPQHKSPEEKENTAPMNMILEGDEEEEEANTLAAAVSIPETRVEAVISTAFPPVPKIHEGLESNTATVTDPVPETREGDGEEERVHLTADPPLIETQNEEEAKILTTFAPLPEKHDDEEAITLEAAAPASVNYEEEIITSTAAGHPILDSHQEEEANTSAHVDLVPQNHEQEANTETDIASVPEIHGEQEVNIESAFRSVPETHGEQEVNKETIAASVPEAEIHLKEELNALTDPVAPVPKNYVEETTVAPINHVENEKEANNTTPDAPVPEIHVEEEVNTETVDPVVPEIHVEEKNEVNTAITAAIPKIQLKNEEANTATANPAITEIPVKEEGNPATSATPIQIPQILVEEVEEEPNSETATAPVPENLNISIESTSSFFNLSDIPDPDFGESDAAEVLGDWPHSESWTEYTCSVVNRILDAQIEADLEEFRMLQTNPLARIQKEREIRQWAEKHGHKSKPKPELSEESKVKIQSAIDEIFSDSPPRVKPKAVISVSQPKPQPIDPRIPIIPPEESSSSQHMPRIKASSTSSLSTAPSLEQFVSQSQSESTTPDANPGHFAAPETIALPIPPLATSSPKLLKAKAMKRPAAALLSHEPVVPIRVPHPRPESSRNGNGAAVTSGHGIATPKRSNPPRVGAGATTPGLGRKSVGVSSATKPVGGGIGFRRASSAINPSAAAAAAAKTNTIANPNNSVNNNGPKSGIGAMPLTKPVGIPQLRKPSGSAAGAGALTNRFGFKK